MIRVLLKMVLVYQKGLLVFGFRANLLRPSAENPCLGPFVSEILVTHSGMQLRFPTNGGKTSPPAGSALSGGEGSQLLGPPNTARRGAHYFDKA